MEQETCEGNVEANGWVPRLEHDEAGGRVHDESARASWQVEAERGAQEIERIFLAWNRACASGFERFGRPWCAAGVFTTFDSVAHRERRVGDRSE